MSRTKVVMACSAAALTLASAGRAEMKRVPVVRLHAVTEVAAPASAVWAYLVQGKSLATWCPIWKSAADSRTTLTRVGDVLDFTDEWGNNGRSVVTYLVKDKELRVAHEPHDGSYMCQAKIVLSPGDKGTTIHYWDQYTDESAEKDLQATACKMETEMEQALAVLKKGVEQGAPAGRPSRR